MKQGGLSLDETADVLGASLREVRLALLEGEFAGRFLVRGEVRIPEGDVVEARERWRMRTRVVDAEIEGDIVSTRGEFGSGTGLAGRGVEELKAAVLEVLREERDALQRLLLDPLERQDDRLHQLEDEVREMRSEVRALGAGSEPMNDWGSEADGGRPVDFRGLVREIADLEALLGDFE